MKKPTRQKLLTLGVILGGLGIGVPAAASSTYSAARSDSVRLVWRAGMGRHAYIARTGARYSEHLGVRYGYNADKARTIWYTTAHEELYDKASHHEMVYYHVYNADQTSGGWIWRGYLRPATKRQVATGKAVKQTVAAAPTRASISPAAQPMTQTDTASLIQNGLVQKLDAPVMQAFPNATLDDRLYSAADDYLNIGDGEDLGEYDNTAEGTANFQKDYIWMPVTQFKRIYFNAKDPSSAASIDQALSAAGFDAATRASYGQGWYVGGGVLPLNTDEEGEAPGNGLVILAQETK